MYRETYRERARTYTERRTQQHETWNGTGVEKFLPQNVEAEASVIGSILIDPEMLAQTAWLPASMFYREAHRLIWQAALDLRRHGVDADVVTITDELTRCGKLEEIGGVSFVSALANQVPTSKSAVQYAHIVERCAMLRNLINAAGQIAGLAYQEADPEVVRREALGLIVDATKGANAGKRGKPLSEWIKQLVDETDARMAGDARAMLIPTGFAGIDCHFGGFEPRECWYICARPSHGKSGLGLQMLFNAGDHVRTHGGGTVDLVTLEMGAIQQTARGLTAFAHISTQQIRSGFRDASGTVDERGYEEFIEKVGRYNARYGEVIHIEEDSMTVDELYDYVATVVAERDSRVLVVDQFDLFDSDDRDSRRALEYTSKMLKKIARDFNIVVIVLCQLNRNIEERPVDKRRPQFNDIRGTGRVEQDADGILMLYRPRVYTDTISDDVAGSENYANYAEVWLTKVRGGRGQGKRVVLSFVDVFASFEDWPQEWTIPDVDAALKS